MHPRWAILAALLAALFLAAVPGVAVAGGGAVAQPVGGQDDATEETDEGGTAGEEVPEGQSDPETETGAEGEAEEAATETGPPWTYQMARISLVLLVLLGLAVFRAYHKLVASRQKGAA